MDLDLLVVANTLILAANETRMKPIGAILVLSCPLLQIGATKALNTAPRSNVLLPYIIITSSTYIEIWNNNDQNTYIPFPLHS